METNYVNVENFTDFVYYDTELNQSPPRRQQDWCSQLVPWWGALVGQASLLLLLLIIYRLFRLCPRLNCPHPANIVTLYVNLSLWAWATFLVLVFTTCSIDVSSPLVITAIVFVACFGFGSILDCFCGTEGWYLVDLKLMADAIHQLEKMKTSPPVHRVHIECFHIETFTLFNTRGRIFTRSRKVVTYTDHRDFPYSSWSDVSDWPVLESIANQGILIIGMNLERVVEPGDPDTNTAFNNFRNTFVQQNCHRDEQVRTWVSSEIPDMGREQSLFISTKPKEEMPFIFKIGFFLVLSSLCLSCPLRTLIRKKTKLLPLKVRKVYFADPEKLSPYNHHQAANGSGHTNPVYAKQNGPHQLHQQNGPHQLPHNQKVLLDVDPQHADTNTTKTIPTKPEPETSINLNKPPALAPAPAGSEFSVDKLSKKVNAGADNQKFILLSPMYGSKAMLVSPAVESRVEEVQAGYLLLHLDHQQPHTQTQPRTVSSGANSNLVQLNNMNHRLDKTGRPTNIYKEASMTDKSNLRDWQDGFGQYSTERKNYASSEPGVYLAGKDYYDESLYNQRKPTTPLSSLHNNFGGYYDDEERLYGPSQVHPRVAMLKNTNIESELRGRVDYTDNRRVHYQEREYRRQESPSPGPRQRAAYPVEHRSRRGGGQGGVGGVGGAGRLAGVDGVGGPGGVAPGREETWEPGYEFAESFPEEEGQYNA